MKNLRQLCVAIVFTFALAIPAFAGDIETGIAPPTTPKAVTAGERQATVAGDIETPANDSATNIALNLLQSVLSLF